jgi:glutaredoxin
MYIIYGTASCTYCVEAKKLLEREDKDYTYSDITVLTATERSNIEEIANKVFRTVPQIFKLVDNEMVYIGGYTNLKEDLS